MGAELGSQVPGVTVGEPLSYPAVGTAHAKAILFGEHAVNYGAPAVAVPVHALSATATLTPREPGSGLVIDCELYTGPALEAPRRIAPVLTAVALAGKRLAPARAASKHTVFDVDLTLSISSSVPFERGLGSSAAVGAAIVRAFMNLTSVGYSRSFQRSDFLELVRLAECVAHGSSSGLDPQTVVAAGPIAFQNRRARPINVAVPLTFVLADTGVPGSTGTAVAQVKARHDEHPESFAETLRGLTEHSHGAIADLAAGDVPSLGRHMTEVHALLADLGISTPALDTLARAAIRAGGLGAKLTGGGRGGCIVALAAGTTAAEQSAQAAQLAARLRAAGAHRTWTTTLEAS